MSILLFVYTTNGYRVSLLTQADSNGKKGSGLQSQEVNRHPVNTHVRVQVPCVIVA